MRKRFLVLTVILLTSGLLASHATAAPPIQPGAAYTVQVDDPLWRLAERYPGDGNRSPPPWAAGAAAGETASRKAA